MTNNKMVSYHYNTDAARFTYATDHCMKPQRLAVVNDLIFSYQLNRKMKLVPAGRASVQDITRFHCPEYVDFLQRITPRNITEHLDKMSQFLEPSCPVFDGLFTFNQTCTAASIEGAVLLNHGESNIAINWSGGFHHALKNFASGYCYLNDIVISILELLKWNPRVLYIDIDFHHGNGVQEAFYLTDRVMTVSFHMYGENVFPNTGTMTEIGEDSGKFYNINVPLEGGITDDEYQRIFEPVIQTVMDFFRPSVVVLQCGADSLAGDRLGLFGLTIKGHGRCVSFITKYNLPCLVLGGGGYKVRNVARCWTYETSLLLDEEISDQIPCNSYFKYYAPDFQLHPNVVPRMKSNNSNKYIENLREYLCNNLKRLHHCPSVQIQEIPPDALTEDNRGTEDHSCE